MLVLMSFVIYALIGLMPGDPIDLMMAADPHLTAADASRLKALYGVGQPLITRYLSWAHAVLAGDLGYSRLFSAPVVRTLLPRLGNSLVLMGSSFVFAFLLALGLGIAAARRPGSRFDAAVNLVAFAGVSLPTFWLALILILIFAQTLRWLPAGRHHRCRRWRHRRSAAPPGAAGGDADHRQHRRLHPLCPSRNARRVGARPYPHRPRQRGKRGAGDLASRAAQRPGADRDDPRFVVRHPRLRRPRHRGDVRLSRDGETDLRRGDGQRLQPRACRPAAGDGGDDGGEPCRRSRLCLARPAGGAAKRPRR